jgi:hypothetical protein
MTPVRQQRKPPVGPILRAGAAAFFLAVGLVPGPTFAITERIVSDRLTGLAIEGFDPVAYFVDGEPVAGSPEYEQYLGGVVWRFRNEGNRAAFVRDPDVYMPAFGGYDPLALTRGVALPGNPLLWLIADQRLFFFFSPAGRAQFAATPQTATALAEGKWPDVQNSLIQR